MNNQNQDNIAGKQAYLRDNISQEKYEDFGEYCENEVGNLDIEKWSLQYIKDLVEKFKKTQAQKESANRKKQHQSFYSYQTGNAKQLIQLRQQIKQEQKQVTQVKEPQKPKSPEVTKQKTQQSALQLLDSIFSNTNNNPSQNQNQYETKKYDKAFFESTNFWNVPSEQPNINKNQAQGSPNTASKNQASLPVNPLPLDNFQKVFQTGINLPQQRNHQTQKKVEKKNENIGNSQTKQAREWKLIEIPIQQDDGPQKLNVSKEQIPSQRQSQLQQSQSVVKKSNIRLISVKKIKTVKTSKLPYAGEVLIKQTFKNSVACFKSLERMDLSSKDLKVSIENHQIITRSFFSSNYVMYHLNIMPSRIVCKRNLEDFQKLKRNLQGVYPGIRLPHLQKVGWLGSQTTAEFIQKQKKYLTYFLEDILSHPQLRNSRILQDFLTLKDHKSIKRKFEEYEKIKKVTSIEQLCLMEGEVKVQISEKNRQYNQLMGNLLQKMNIFWQSQEKILAEIDAMYAGLIENYRRWGDSVQQIKRQIKNFNKYVTFNQIGSMETAMDDLSSYIDECRTFNFNEKQFLQSNIFPIFSYQKQNMNLLNPILTAEASLTKQYLKRREGERSQDNTQYLSERLKDFKENILEESKNITVLKHQCGYVSNVAASEGFRYFQRLSGKLSHLVSDVCSGKLKKISQSINTFTELVNA